MSELLPPPPPPLLTAVKVGMTSGVGVERINITVDVKVGVGVSVLGGVGVFVVVCVEVGSTADVCVDAALTVCAMNVLTTLGSTGGNGVVASDGTQAKTIPTTINHTISLALYVNIFPLAPETRKTLLAKTSRSAYSSRFFITSPR